MIFAPEKKSNCWEQVCGFGNWHFCRSLFPKLKFNIESYYLENIKSISTIHDGKQCAVYIDTASGSGVNGPCRTGPTPVVLCYFDRLSSPMWLDQLLLHTCSAEMVVVYY